MRAFNPGMNNTTFISCKTSTPVLGSTLNGYRRFFPRGLSAQSVRLTTHLHIVPKLRMCGATPHLLYIHSWREHRQLNVPDGPATSVKCCPDTMQLGSPTPFKRSWKARSFYMHTATYLCVPPLQNPCLSQTENLKMKIHTSTLSSHLCGRGTWSITLTEVQGLEAIKDIILQ